jgi:hypothetical protein
MNLYPHDCSYLNTEYGKRKSQECYEIETKERHLDDGKQEGNEYENAAGCRGQREHRLRRRDT